MRGSRSLRAVLLGSGAMLLSTLVAAAQSADEVQLDEVVIASKRDVATGTAVAVTEVNQQEIDDRQAGTIAELIETVPGVTLINGTTPVGSGINLRGYGSSGSYGHNQKVMVLIDGAAQGGEELYRVGTQLYSDPDLFRRVEVIRGTVGSFEYGSGVVGGIVKLETKDASDFTGGEPGFRVRQALTYGSNGDSKTSSTILAWQPNDNLELLANYIWRETNVQKDGDGDKIDSPPSKLPSFNLKAKYFFGQNGEHALSFSHADTKTSERDVPYDAFGEAGPTFGNVDRDIDSRTTVLSYHFNPAGNDLVNVEVSLSRAAQEFDSRYIWGSSPEEGQSYFPDRVLALAEADHRYVTTKLVAKNTANFALGGFEHELRAGIELSKRERAAFGSAPGGTDKRTALFLVDEMTRGGLTLTPALRYESQKIASSDKNPAAHQGEYENDALMGGLSARYEFGNGFSVFGSLAYTEGLPILDDFDAQRKVNAGKTYNYMEMPEKARTMEVGAAYLGSDLLSGGDAFSVKANYYQTHVWDITSDSSHVRHDLRGLEIEAAYSMENGFYSDLNANFVDYSRTSYAGVSDVYHPGQPADQLRLTLGKRFGEGLDLSWEAVHNFRYDETGDTVSKSSTVHNLRATYRPETGVLAGTELRLGIENAFDLDYKARLATRDAVGRNVKLSLVKTF